MALDWRPEQTEEHAIIAAFALGAADFSSVDASTRASALARALERVEGRRTMDDRLRIALISALRRLDHPTSAAALERVMSRADPAQSFLINRIAAEALGRLTDLPSIPSLVLALFRFAPDDPRMRINDLAAIALVQRGGHALAPTLALLRGENAEALAIARRYVESMSAIDAAAAARMTPESIVRAEAVYLLGQLGGPQSLEPLLAETRVSDDERRVLAAGALIRLVGLTSADAARVREAVERVYRASRDERGRLFLLAAIQHSHDPGHLPLLLGIAQRSGAGSDRAVAAYRAAVRLAGPREAVALRRIASRARRGSRLHFVESEPALKAVERCDEDVACWRELLSAGRPLVAAQAAAMLARLRERESSPPGTPSGAAVHSLDTGDGERRPEMRAAELGRAREGARQPTVSDVVPALLAQLDSPHVPLRVEVLYALDRICVATCEEVITAIDALRDREEGRRSWHEVSSLALEVRARQVARRC